jgi:hypothetical protein
MAAKGPFEIPVGMRRVCRRFERWRKGRQAHLPIPDPLWAAAAEAARAHPPCPGLPKAHGASGGACREASRPTFDGQC